MTARFGRAQAALGRAALLAAALAGCRLLAPEASYPPADPFRESDPVAFVPAEPEPTADAPARPERPLADVLGTEDPAGPPARTAPRAAPRPDPRPPRDEHRAREAPAADDAAPRDEPQATEHPLLAALLAFERLQAWRSWVIVAACMAAYLAALLWITRSQARSEALMARAIVAAHSPQGTTVRFLTPEFADLTQTYPAGAAPEAIVGDVRRRLAALARREQAAAAQGSWDLAAPPAAPGAAEAALPVGTEITADQIVPPKSDAASDAAKSGRETTEAGGGSTAATTPPGPASPPPAAPKRIFG
jgi:hypothetical protein